MEKNWGFKPTKMNGTEWVFGVSNAGANIPKHYSYKKFLPSVLDQGSDPICVPCSISAFLNWRQNLATGSKKDNKIDYYQIFDSRTTEGEGMTFKEAFKFLRHNGVDSNAGKLKIGQYSKVGSGLLLKFALITNGPCVGALPVYNDGDTFWKKSGDDDYLTGYHAISIVGYDEKGFIIRNSWGDYFGEKGYTHLPSEDFNKFIELWTVA